MVKRLISLSLDKPAMLVMLVGAAVCVGLLWLQDLPRDVFPDLATPVFNVIVQNP